MIMIMRKREKGRKERERERERGRGRGKGEEKEKGEEEEEGVCENLHESKNNGDRGEISTSYRVRNSVGRRAIYCRARNQ